MSTITEGIYTIFTAMPGKPEMCLDVFNASEDPVTPLILYHVNGQKNQQFRFSLVDEPAGYYKIEAMHTGQVLDVECCRGKDLDPVIQYEYHDGDNQLWKVTQLANGNYTIASKKGGFVIAVDHALREDKARIVVSQWHERMDQQFKLVPVK